MAPTDKMPPREAEHESKPSAAGGWGSVEALASILTQEEIPLLGPEVLMKQNKPDGFMCVSCSWAKPAEPHAFEFCENGAKATAWEITGKRTTPEFFERHTVSELREWSDHMLEEHGRLTHPLRYDAASDKYLPVSWERAFAEIGAELKKLDPKSVIMYTSGRASLEASYMYQLFGRMYGTNNFPDSSNMCHESTSVGLPPVIGVPVGTVHLSDFDKSDCIFFFGHNTTTNAPRMLHPLQRAAKRGVPIVTFNPLRERGLERFVNPQSPTQMVAGGTRISSQYCQLRCGGDIAAIAGICKAVIEADDAAKASGAARIIDVDFIARHTHGFESFADFCRRQDWRLLEKVSGVSEAELRSAADTYMNANAVIANYGMGVTQHEAIGKTRGTTGTPGRDGRLPCVMQMTGWAWPLSTVACGRVPCDASYAPHQVYNKIMQPEVASVFITEELAKRRESRRGFFREVLPFHTLTKQMVDDPSRALPLLVETALQLCDAVSGGISLYEPEPAPGIFRWHHLRGDLERFTGATTPRHHSPCGITLDRRSPILVQRPERVYTWLQDAKVSLPECLLVPLYLGADELLGTLWIVSEAEGQFDGRHADALADLAGFVGLALRMSVDQQKLKGALDVQQLLTREMAHRLKNVLAVVQALMDMAARRSTTAGDLAAKMTTTLHALSVAQTVATSQSDESSYPPPARAGLAELLELILAPYVHASINVNGPEIPVGMQATNVLALVFHELATNSAKYGALSCPQGVVAVEWMSGASDLSIRWSERNGPRIAGPPVSSGFGTLLAAKSIATLRGSIKSDWLPDGLLVQITVPTAHLLIM